MSGCKINLAKTTGFCFGVGRAVDICQKLAKEGKRAVTLGPIIHNERVVKEFERMGIKAIKAPSEAAGDCVLVIRSHGVSKEVYTEIERLGLEYIDATCPCVNAIHRIVSKGAAGGRTILIAGDAGHPEVVGIAGNSGQNRFIFEDADSLVKNIFPLTGDVPVLMVAQTTFNLIQYTMCIEAAKAYYSDIRVFETVCASIIERQREARLLSAENDVCFVIGGKGSSNTEKLREICEKSSAAYSVESADELTAAMLKGAVSIGITSGTSTPAPVIQEVLKRMDELIKENGNVIEDSNDNAAGESRAEEFSNEQAIGEPEEAGEQAADPKADLQQAKTEETEEEAQQADSDPSKEEDFNFEMALENSLRQVHRNQRVSGVVTQIRSNEVVVDIGSKHTGIIPAEELSDDTSQKPEDIVSVGDKLNLLVIATNDQEGIATLSKKRLDSSMGLEVLSSAADQGEVLDAFVLELVNNGLIAIAKSIRIFVPASQATLRFGEKYEKLLRTNVKLKILEVNPARRRVIGSIRAVLLDELNSKRDAFWSTVEVGMEYTGTVKSLTSYGAFVDLGGVDGMVHISELSWQRVRNPSDVITIGEEITVRVREVDRERKRISLSYRKQEDNPWNKFEENFTIGDVFPAKVVSLTKFGAFVRILPGIDGLVHISEISQEHIEKASDVLSAGDDVMVKLIGIEGEKKRISLSMKYEGAPVLEIKTQKKSEKETETGSIKTETEPDDDSEKPEKAEDTATESDETAAGPEVITAEPEEAKTVSDETAAGPEVIAAEPEEAETVSDETAAEPEAIADEPEVTEAEPDKPEPETADNNDSADIENNNAEDNGEDEETPAK